MTPLIQLGYLISTVLFIYGLKSMSSPLRARHGITVAGAGMLIAVIATLFWQGMSNYALMFMALAAGSAIAWRSAKQVAMTDMPQMIALYNGMGGGAAAAIAMIELIRFHGHGTGVEFLAIAGAMIGGVSFTGSLVAFGKLQGLVKRSVFFPRQMQINAAVGFLMLLTGLSMPYSDSQLLLFLFFVLTLAFGLLMTLPVGGADMPVVISLFNAFTGLAVGLEGFVLENAAMIVAGTVVGAAGTLLTQLMAKAMNRPLKNILFAAARSMAGKPEAEADIDGSLRATEPRDAAAMMAFARSVIIAPGYGMAVAQAQHKIWELADLLQQQGVKVRFAVHPVAGRMPGHMNVLLAEAGVPYDMISDLDEINSEFANADVALVIGANDVVNPMARTHPDSPIYGMPVLNVDQAKNVLVIKRGQGTGYSGIENALFYKDQTRMLYGDGQSVAGALIQAVKELK